MRVVLSSLWILMMIACIWASLAIPLWEEWSILKYSPWFIVTLADLYVGLILFSIFTYLLRRNWVHTAIWTLLFFCGGNITTIIWLFLNWRAIRDKFA